MANETKQHEKTFKVVVNGRQRDVTTDVLSYNEVLALAYGQIPPTEENVTYDVLYHHADQHPSEGELIAGGSVSIKNKTSFDVTRTTRS